MPKRRREDSSSPSASDASTNAEGAAPETPSALQHTVKYVQTSNEQTARKSKMKCSLPPHPEVLSFETFDQFEIHYAKAHANRCSECRHNFPTEHFLSLHISENHDPLVEVKRTHGEKTYRCFVEFCDKICSTPQKRRMHLADKHMFPKNYDFQIVNTGIDKRSSMLRTKHQKNKSSHSQIAQRGRQSDQGSAKRTPPSAVSSPEASNHLSASNSANQEKCSSPEADVEDVTSAMSSLKFVPPSIRFGRGGKRGFYRS